MKIFLYLFFISILPILIILWKFKIKFNLYEGVRNYKNITLTESILEKTHILIFMILIGIAINYSYSQNVKHYKIIYLCMAGFIFINTLGNKNVNN